MSSKRQQIVDAVKTRFEGITVAGGYNFTLTNRVYAWRATAAEPAEFPILNIRDVDVKTTRVVLGTHDHDMKIEVFMVTGNGDSTAADLRKLEADIITAIGVDRTWNGLALDTIPGESNMEVFEPNNVTGDIKLSFTIKFRTNSWNPNT